MGLITKPCFSEWRKESAVDGHEWGSMPIDAKTGWVVGFRGGLNQAISEGFLFRTAQEVAQTIKSRGLEDPGEERATQFVNICERTLNLSEITDDQLIAGLDKFYKDYRNKGIMGREAIYIVKLEVMGAPQEFIDEEARLLRMPEAERYKEWSSLREKNQAYKEASEKWGKYLPISVIPTP